MFYPQALQEAVLIKRYKRFLADVRLADGQTLTIHCPNTGSMRNCAQPGSRVWMSRSENPKRKYAHTWELLECTRSDEGLSIEGMASIHSARANALVKEGIEQGVIEPLQGYASLRTERPYGLEKSRIDILLEDPARVPCYVEVKSVTLAVGEGLGIFPDAVSARGLKHLRELQAVAAQGQRAVLLFCVQHTAIARVEPAWQVDPAYAQALVQAMDAGVEVLAYACSLSPLEARISHALPFSLALEQKEGSPEGTQQEMDIR